MTEAVTPTIRVQDVVGRTIVLGSTQQDSVVDAGACAAAGVDVVRRRSGGGAVLLVEGEVTWVDVTIPRRLLADDDIHTPMRWLGQVFAEAVESLFESAGSPATVAVSQTMGRTTWSDVICFEGLGPGEVLVDGRKLVGMSQRRTRHEARLHCCWYHAYRTADIAALLAAGARPEVGELHPPATLPADWSAAIIEATRSALQRLGREMGENG